MWPRKIVNQERNNRHLLHGPETIFDWLTDLGKISSFSLDNVRRSENDIRVTVIKFYLTSANNAAEALNLGIGHCVQSKA